ncbi:type II toxin-antitoxin system HicA family toxin [Urbifossiella limnaea]|uniref:YcfA-like protein n=1 Tax=Urbifossiella limnaea TaxID=2528023 RepID=A0A517XKX1_9BACT|nr:YcfA-like protein [Urbifossiella limnaea]
MGLSAWQGVGRKAGHRLTRWLERAGVVNRGGRGSHRNFEHPVGPRVTLSGQEGDDAKPYQEREVDAAITESEGGEGEES